MGVLNHKIVHEITRIASKMKHVWREGARYWNDVKELCWNYRYSINSTYPLLWNWSLKTWTCVFNFLRMCWEYMYINSTYPLLWCINMFLFFFLLQQSWVSSIIWLLASTRATSLFFWRMAEKQGLQEGRGYVFSLCVGTSVELYLASLC